MNTDQYQNQQDATNAERQRDAEIGTATEPPAFLKPTDPERSGNAPDFPDRQAVADRAKRKAKRIAERNKRLSKMKDDFSVLFAGLGPRFSIDELVGFAGQNNVEVLFNQVTGESDEDADPPASTKAMELSVMSDEPVINAHQRLTASHQGTSMIPAQSLSDDEAKEQAEHIKQLQLQRRERDTKGPVDLDKDPITGVLPPPIPGAESRAPNEEVTLTKGVGQA